MINTANESRKSVAATESFRNEMVKQGVQTQQILLVAAQLANREQDGRPLEQAEICE
jgi:hypothetical protein